MGKRPTIRDVAAAAQVSTATVSQILRHGGNDLISEGTVKRVRAIADRLGYRANLLASSLGAGKSNIIGVISSRIDIRIMVRKIEAAERRLSARGYTVVVLDARGQGELETEYASLLSRGLFDGILIASDTSQLLRDELKGLGERRRPIVTLEPIDDVDLDCVTVDRTYGAHLAVSHLLSLGHVRIAFLSGDPTKKAIKDRYAGFEKALREHGLGPEHELVVAMGAVSPCEEGYEAARKVMAETPPPTGMFCLSDDVAIGAIAYLREAKIRVPEDVAIVGFDNIEVGRYASVPLTTVSQPAEEVGTRAAGMLLDRIDAEDGSDERAHVVIKPELIVRESCGASLLPEFRSRSEKAKIKA